MIIIGRVKLFRFLHVRFDRRQKFERLGEALGLGPFSERGRGPIYTGNVVFHCRLNRVFFFFFRVDSLGHFGVESDTRGTVLDRLSPTLQFGFAIVGESVAPEIVASREADECVTTRGVDSVGLFIFCNGAFQLFFIQTLFPELVARFYLGSSGSFYTGCYGGLVCSGVLPAGQ